MSFFVIIRGYLGVGKTTVAKQVARKIKAKYFSIDEILAKNKLDRVCRRCIPLENFLKGNEIVLKQAKTLLAKGKPIVFDGNFYHKGNITHLVRNLRVPHKVFTLKAPLKVCIARDAQRKGSYGKWPVIAVYNLVNNTKYGKTINTNKKSSNQVVKEIVSVIKSS
jgi:predicted kinase